VTPSADVGSLLRELTPQALGALVRHYGDFGGAEDALQEALLTAALQWSAEGVPENPRGWLIRVASRRYLDWRRRETVRLVKEAASELTPTYAPGPDEVEPARDDSLTLLFLCCHPALARPAQVALTLRAVGGLTTAEIASAYLVPEGTMAQRINRAKNRIRGAGIPFRMPTGADRGPRIAAILQVLYLIFNEGYTATSGPQLQRTDLSAEAIRLTRQLRHLLPDEGEVAGLLALMLLTDGRRGARTDPDGALIPLAEQDRSRWDRAQLDEGIALVTDALASAPIGPYQVQAAIGAVHAEAPIAEQTRWPEILALYGLLEKLAPGPMVTLNRAVALAMVNGPRAGLDLLATLDDEPRLTRHHRLAAVRAHLLELAGDPAAARAGYLLAARLTSSVPEQRYLHARAARLDGAT
jgi:RNA polymerase sigma factor (sigma-70 family)